jgi:UDP:flavonoid glycosyltransferase YjiC (YdhE family)
VKQKDICGLTAGHNKIRAFVTHGGLLSMFETVYHGVPVVTMPVFCDHDANSAKAVLDGYALMLELEELTTEKLVWAINEVIHDPK